jgi:hypothetical protein
MKIFLKLYTFVYIYFFYRGSDMVMKVSALLSSKTSTAERKEISFHGDQHRFVQNKVHKKCFYNIVHLFSFQEILLI